jgi:hypothetical protein
LRLYDQRTLTSADAITIDRYQKMVATGVLTRDDHVELIEGEILHTAPISPQHARVTARLCKRLTFSADRDTTVETDH